MIGLLDKLGSERRRFYLRAAASPSRDESRLGSGRRRDRSPAERRRSELREPLPVDYVTFHPTGERMSIEVARARAGEWQPESERDELREFLAGTADPADAASLLSRDFTSIETGAVCLSRGVRWEAPAAVGSELRPAHVHHQEVVAA